MSGGIFQPLDILADFEDLRRNPLLCYLCNSHYEEPCLLTCYHSFCSRCLRGRLIEGQMTCPLCGTVTMVKDGSSLPPKDCLLKFLVESVEKEKVQCANCDALGSQMYFCNTCEQPLCTECRENTHQAKMFAKHEIVVLSKRTKEIHRKCALHGEPYIMFSAEDKVMLCINCFRDTNIESRSHCVDLETAYTQGCKKLDQEVQAIRELQNSVRDGIILLRALLDDIKQNSDKEKESIRSLHTTIQDTIKEKRNLLIREVDRQYKEKKTVFKKQLTALNTVLPTLHVNLVTCTAFTCSANKYEFLDLAFKLMSRLRAIEQLQHPISPLQSSRIITDFKVEFARCLEPLLSIKPLRESPSVSMVNLNSSNGGSVRMEVSASSTMMVPNLRFGILPVRRGSQQSLSSKRKIIEKNSVFSEHCKEFDSQMQELNQRFEKLKCQVQELHRDLTLRRCMSKKNELDSLLKDCTEVNMQISQQFEHTEISKATLEKYWEETFQRTAVEQEIYQAQVNDLVKLRQEHQHLITITRQLEPFLKSISDVTERLAPKLGANRNSGHEDTMHELLEQISTMQPDSQQRVDAIRTAQEERQIHSASKVNPIDDELIKTKEKLKAPRVRRDCSSPMLDPDVTFTIIVPKDQETQGQGQGQGQLTSVKNETVLDDSNECEECVNADVLEDTVAEDINLTTQTTTQTNHYMPRTPPRSPKVENDDNPANNNVNEVLEKPGNDSEVTQNDSDASGAVKVLKNSNDNSSCDFESDSCKTRPLKSLHDIEKGICKEKIRQMEEKAAGSDAKTSTTKLKTNSLEKKKVNKE